MKPAITGLSRPLVIPLAINIVLGLLICGSYLLQALVLALLIDALLAGSQPSSSVHFLSIDLSLAYLISAIVLIMLLRALLMWLHSVQTEYLASRARNVLRERLLNPLLSPGYDIQQHYTSAELRSISMEGVESMGSFYSHYIPSLVLAVSSSMLILAVLGSMDWVSAALIAAFIVAIPLIDHLWMRWQNNHVVGIYAAMQRFADNLMDALQGMVALKAFNAVARYRSRLADQATVLRRESMSTLRVILMRSAITSFISLSGIAVLLSVNAWRVAEHTLNPLVLLFSLLLARELFRPVITLNNAFGNLWAAQEVKPAMQQLTSAEPVVLSPERPAPVTADSTLRLEQLSFRWPGQQREALSHIDLTIGNNQHLAFVGPSGSGKSTIVQLIARFIDPDKGNISLGGVPYHRIDLEQLRQRISIVSQQIFLLQGSLADNLRLANSEASDDELWHCLELAQLSNWAQALPQGLDTHIDERGANLSGGQRQRLAIARALLKKSPILILDEATSNLDLANEQALYKSLEMMEGHCTIINIAHRPQAVANAHHIVVLEDGHVVERGSHAQLMARQGYYARHFTVAEGLS